MPSKHLSRPAQSTVIVALLTQRNWLYSGEVALLESFARQRTDSDLSEKQIVLLTTIRGRSGSRRQTKIASGGDQGVGSDVSCNEERPCYGCKTGGRMAKTLTIDDLIVWYYDDRNVTGGYVLLESDDPTTMQRVQRALMSAGLHCRKHGACFRAAHNKKMYKTFIRVEQSSGESPALAVIKGAIKTLPNAHYDANPVDIRTYVNRLSETIAQKDAAITALQQRLRESRQELDTLRRQRGHEHASLQAQPGSDPAAPLDPVGIASQPVEDREATYRAMEMYEQQLHEREACIRQLQADLPQAVYARDHASAKT